MRWISATVAVLLTLVGTGVAQPSQDPLVFAGGTTDIAAIVDQDGDGPDLTDDCYFKMTAARGLTGPLTISYVNALGMGCDNRFPCTSSFELQPKNFGEVDVGNCGVLGATGLNASFFRPGTQPFGPALLSPNSLDLTENTSPIGGGFLCAAAGPAAMVTPNGGGPAMLFSMSFVGPPENPTYLRIPMVGGQLGGSGDIFAPLLNKMVSLGFADDPLRAVVDLGGLCECSRFGQCLGLSAPTVSEWGIMAVALGLLAGGTLVLRRRASFAQGLRLP